MHLTVRQRLLGLTIFMATFVLAVGTASYFILSQDQSRLVNLPQKGAIQASLEQGHGSGRMILGLTVVGAAICLVLGLGLSRRVHRPLNDLSRVAQKVARGDLSERLSLGSAIRCSDIMGCYKEDCPCYDRESHCWAEAGSFCSKPSCPKALEGMDCHECQVFKKAGLNEFEELSSALYALAEELGYKADVAAGIARGDLCQEVRVASDQDTLGLSLEGMVDSLNQVLYLISEAAQQVATGSRQISQASQTLSEGAATQAASLEQISSAMTEISSQTKTNAEHAGQASDLSRLAKEAADNGVSRMEKMMAAIGAISESSQKISKIIRTIDDIAFQTNLLALNAAVEAARAGRHGKGFAVVAQEVRQLAVRSAQAARETSELITSSTSQVEEGSAFTEQTVDALVEIMETVTKLGDLIAEISTASSEQAHGLAQMSQGLSQVEGVTQHNTAQSEQTSSAAEHLSHQATRLHDLLARFKLRQPTKGLTEN